MFLQRNYARTVCAFSRYINTFRCVKGVTHSPILVRALLLHLYRLLQFAVGGAEVVVPLHVGASCLAAWVASAQVVPGAPPFEARSFPTVSFQLWSRPSGEGRRGGASNRRGTLGPDRRRSWLNHKLVRSDERQTGEPRADGSLC